MQRGDIAGQDSKPVEDLCVQSGEVPVIEFSIDRPPRRALELVDDSERERARKCVFERDRRRFMGAHAWLHRHG